MGLCSSAHNDRIRAQEHYVNKRMKDKDIGKLKNMRDTFFHPGARKYNDNQLRGYLRQEYHGARKLDSYVLNQDLRSAGVSGKRHR